MKIQKCLSFLSVLSLCAALGYAENASATSTCHDSWYVCRVSLKPPTSTLGSYGYVYLNFSANADCSGAVQAEGNICSTGATYAGCSSSYLFNEASLLAQFQALASAAMPVTARNTVPVCLDDSGSNPITSVALGQ